jgi:hypothetical protein
MDGEIIRIKDMDYLEFIQEIQKLGINMSTQNSEIDIYSPMGVNKKTLKITPLSIVGDGYRFDEEAGQDAIKWAIDFDKWQHSWHNEIKPENYERFLEIIQGKVIEKAKSLTQLFSISVFLENKIKELNENNVSTVPDSNINDDYEPF